MPASYMRCMFLVLVGLVLVLSGSVAGDCCGPPWIYIIEPAEDADVSAGCEIVAKLVDCPLEVKAVRFLVDGEVVGSDDTADEEGKFSFQWDGADAEAGEHIISAKAKLANGDIVTKSDEVKVVVKETATTD